MLEGECCFSYSQELSLVVIIFLLTVVLAAVSMLGMARVERRLRLPAALGNLERISVCMIGSFILCCGLCWNLPPRDDPSFEDFGL